MSTEVHRAPKAGGDAEPIGDPTPGESAVVAVDDGYVYRWSLLDEQHRTGALVRTPVPTVVAGSTTT